MGNNRQVGTAPQLVLHRNRVNCVLIDFRRDVFPRHFRIYDMRIRYARVFLSNFSAPV